jgi:hypothetical protein
MLASRIGAPATLITSGVLCILAVLWFMGRLPEIRREIRPVYIELGIIQQAAVGGDSGGRGVRTSPPTAG